MTSSPGPILRARKANQGIGAGVAANALGNADVVGELSFKTLDGRAAYVAARGKHFLHGSGYLVANLGVLAG